MNEMRELLLIMPCVGDEGHERSPPSMEGANGRSYWEQRADEYMDLRIGQEKRMMLSVGFTSPLPKKLEDGFGWT